MRRCLGFLLFASALACETPGLPGAPCVSDRDCEAPRTCGTSGSCEAPPDPRVALDGGTPTLLGDPDSGASEDAGLNVDAGALDQGSQLDQGSAAVDGGAPDAGPEDLGTPDFGSPDAGSPDVGTPDGGSPSPGSPVVRGQYRFRRINLRELTGADGLWRVAVSPNDSTLVASTYYERIFVLDRTTETVRRTLTLPRDGADRVRIGDLVYLPNGDVLVVATALQGGSPTGRLYRFDPVGTSAPQLVATARGSSLERGVVEGLSADLVGSESLGGGRHVMSLYVFDTTKNTLNRVASRAVNAGCEGLATAADGLGGTARIYACGVGGGDIGHVDGLQSFYPGPGIGNVSHVDGHPNGAYALAVGWASARLVRFQNGTWTTGAAAPDLGTARLQKLEFNGDGSRGLIVGGFERLTHRLELREYRDLAYTSSEVADVSIPNFDQAPYFGANGSGVFDAAWRSSCDEGYMVGGCGSLACSRSWLIHFEVTNGRSCP